MNEKSKWLDAMIRHVKSDPIVAMDAHIRNIDARLGYPEGLEPGQDKYLKVLRKDAVETREAMKRIREGVGQ